MYTAYVATGLDNHAQHRIMSEALLKYEIVVTYDWTTHGPVWSQGQVALRVVAGAEIDAVQKADAVVVILPGGRGTHVELGAALALKKPVALYDPTGLDIGPEDSRIGKHTCAFYHHPNVAYFSPSWRAEAVASWLAWKLGGQ